MTNRTLKLGFVPLTDSAPLITALKRGYFAELGLDVELCPQNSWSTLRDKLQSGMLDAAQLLAPMPLASTLGLDGAKVAMKVPLVLSQNGNAITLSKHLVDEVLSLNKLSDLPFPMPAKLLQASVDKRKKEGKEKLRLASVFPYSCHQYQINDWLRQANLLEHVDVITLPPSAMAESLVAGMIDGFCVGGPWNAKSVREESGVTVLTSYHIWKDKTEKVLAVTELFFDQNPELLIRLVTALIKACEWLEPQINRFEAARWLQQSALSDEPLDTIAPSLLGSCITQATKSPQLVPNYNRFMSSIEESINRPLDIGQKWILTKMREANQISISVKSIELDKLAVFENSIFDEAMKRIKEAQL
ncbi:ABC transporter substrate-binding protein [Glaciecola sp. MH2013]|nr:ABC transporter substrate-binding protein [Glaciecola sp. MH2013]